MIIDCHGHYTTAPKSLEAFRQKQIDSLKDARLSPAKDSLIIRDDEIRDSIEGAQLRIQRERGTDLTITGTDVHVIVRGAAARSFGQEFGMGKLRNGELEAVATRTFNAGVALPLAYVGTEAPE
jgi:hypothetical protein